MPLPSTHNAVAISLLNESIDIHHAQQARGLPGVGRPNKQRFSAPGLV
ncbi:MAG: hypothetical protein P8R54_05865 [Myxococcota bacterium]|nr:hypothetical protein [Myxococcota bacterium]